MALEVGCCKEFKSTVCQVLLDIDTDPPIAIVLLSTSGEENSDLRITLFCFFDGNVGDDDSVALLTLKGFCFESSSR